MIRTFRRLFADHPREVGETYAHHLLTAGRFGVRLARLSGIAFLHALVPGVCKTTVSDEIRRMAADLGGRVEEARDTRMRQAGVWDPGL